MDTGRPTWRSRAWAVAVPVPALLGVVLASAGFDGSSSALAVIGAASAIVALVVTWAALRTRSQRRRYEEELAAWAAERAAQAERLRIARELHDIASHGLGLITVRAAAARALTGPDGEGEREQALSDIEAAGRRTTTELRRMLSVLRAPSPAPLRPADTLDDLPSIVETAGRSGLTTELEVGELGEVTAGVQLTVCAIVREALHNVVRHAGRTTASVRVDREGETVTVRVRDAGPRPGWHPQPGAGHGLDGLRERVAALDGSLDAGRDGDGWLLAARIPDRRRA